jgi:CheY-like chemotaxis protein
VDFVITDDRMPGMNGCDLARMLLAGRPSLPGTARLSRADDSWRLDVSGVDNLTSRQALRISSQTKRKVVFPEAHLLTSLCSIAFERKTY